MSAQLVARGVGAAVGGTTLFSGVDLVVAPGSVTGLVGPNGAGKSTLLRILGSDRGPDGGTVELSPPDALVGWLPQEPDRRPGETVSSFLARRTGVEAAARELTAATAALAAGEPAADDRYSVALDTWLRLGGADLDARVGQVAADLGLEVSLGTEMRNLSGGEAARASLAVLLLSQFDVLLLDEPTNDLDLAGLERLERFVEQAPVGIVVVSHDREFLSRTITQVVELDRQQERVEQYGGGYDAYLTERARRRTQARERFEEYAATRDQLRARARRQRSWGVQGVRSARRDPRDPDKFVKHFDVASSERTAAKARQTDRMLERLDEVAEPRKEWELHLSIESAPRSGDVVAVLDHVVLRRGEFVLGPVTLQVDRGDRIAIVGPNGSGKSTLLSVLTSETPPDEGRVTMGAAVRLGRIDQARSALDVTSPLIDVLMRHSPSQTLSSARTLLAKFGLIGTHLDRAAATLSPGERTRAALALLQAQGVNLLVLDEPTNHLDLPAIEQLESALDAFEGTVLLVTHDRRFLQGFRATRRFLLAAGQVASDRGDGLPDRAAIER